MDPLALFIVSFLKWFCMYILNEQFGLVSCFSYKGLFEAQYVFFSLGK